MSTITHTDAPEQIEGEPDEPTVQGQPDEQTEAVTSERARPVLAFIDPFTVKIEPNVRRKPVVSREFVASVRKNGVLIAMRGYFDADGNPVIRDGQRRILASQKADVHEAAALIYPNRDALVDAVEAERERIIEQFGANSNREDLPELDEADAIQQLALTGMEVTVIAKELSVKPARVTAALAVASSDSGRKAVERGQVTLDQAAVIAEFEDDQEAVKTLTATARNYPGQFAHEAQRIRDRRTARQEQQQFVDDLTAKGIPMVEAPEEHDKREANAFLHELQDADGKALVVDEWVGKPGYAVALFTRYGSWHPAHVITDWRTRGLRRKSSGGAVSGKMTEKEKAERREVVANNKDWDSAETVRREWLTTLLSRKTLPKDAAQFVAWMATERPIDFGRSLENGTAAALLGMEPKHGALATALAVNPGRANLIMFALALAAGELAMARYSWRNPSKRDRAFFTWLTGWGYTAARVENIIAAEPAADKPKRTRRTKSEQPTAEAPEAVEDDTEAAEAEYDEPSEDADAA